jgi:ribosomal protein S18 acetylase RimI-like enzyme
VSPESPQRDDWLSDALGFDAYTVTASSARDVPSAVRAMYTCRVPAAEAEALGVLEEAGFRVVDVNVTLERTGADGPGSASVAPAAGGDDDELLRIAGSAFRYSRFHLDPLIQPEVADRVKREWVRSYLEGRRGIELLAAHADGRVVGFLAVLEAADGARVIDLVGVAAEARGRGIGEALVTEFAHRHGEDGRVLRVGTQVANVPSLRLYEKLGFRTRSATYVMHRHTGLG